MIIYFINLKKKTLKLNYNESHNLPEITAILARESIDELRQQKSSPV